MIGYAFVLARWVSHDFHRDCAFGTHYSHALGVVASSQGGIAGGIFLAVRDTSRGCRGSNGRTSQQVQFASAGDRLHAAVHRELAIDMFEMHFDGRDGEVQFLRNRSIGQARGQDPQHFQLAFG